jgi:hypothetical protein
MLQNTLTALYFLTHLYISYSLPCPNSCSNKGRCIESTATCECFNGFEGPDCSLASCPVGPAWVDTAIGTDLAHQPAVCSNMVCYF